MTNDETDLVDIGALARRLGRSPASLRRWERAGRIPAALREPLTGRRVWPAEQASQIAALMAPRAQGEAR